jgi:zinc transport system ATP-binding protein
VGRQPAERRLLFSSRGKWLHPLFELEEFLRREGLDPGGLLIRDKIVGKAAAMLIVRMGFRRLEAGILSRPGRTVLDNRGIHYLYGELVERILCQTETVLENTWDLEEAYRIVRERAGRGPGRP